jgi:Zn-dependent peptidase ImmA (M78 family)
VIGDRLKLARSAAGLSLRELEDRLGGLVSAQAIGKYERNEMMPGSEVLIALARALSVSEDYLLRSDGVELVAVEFRKHKLDKAKDRARVESLVLGAVERYVEVEDLLAVESDWGQPKGFPRTVAKPGAAEDAADLLRKAWDLGVDPIPRLSEFLEEKAIKIVSVPLPERVSGVNARVSRADGEHVQVIVINSDHDGERQRFTLSHELGHLVLRAKGDDIETCCNRFAGAFLVPADALRRELGEHRKQISLAELFFLKAHFGVSLQALAYRAADLGIIGESLKRQLFIEFGRRGWRKAEPNPLPKEQPGRFRRLCLRAYSEDVVSASKAAEWLGLNVRELLTSLDQVPAQPEDGSPPRL